MSHEPRTDSAPPSSWSSATSPATTPFMAGAIHGVEEAETVLNVGVSGPGVIARALERLIAARQSEGAPLSLD